MMSGMQEQHSATAEYSCCPAIAGELEFIESPSGRAVWSEYLALEAWMSLLQNIMFAGYARSTHHKLALDALPHLQGPNAGGWSDLLLSEYGSYLQGAKAADDTYKDFKNHVATGIRDGTALRQANAARLLNEVIQIADTTECKRILRSGAVPDLEEVTSWIKAAQLPPVSRAAG